MRVFFSPNFSLNRDRLSMASQVRAPQWLPISRSNLDRERVELPPDSPPDSPPKTDHFLTVRPFAHTISSPRLIPANNERNHWLSLISIVWLNSRSKRSLGCRSARSLFGRSGTRVAWRPLRSSITSTDAANGSPSQRLHRLFSSDQTDFSLERRSKS